MGAGGDLAADGMVGIGAEQPKVRVRLGAQQATGGAIGEGGLAHALGADQQPGMVHAPTLQGVQPGALGLLGALQLEHLPRMRDGKRLGHQAGTPRRSCTVRQTAFATKSGAGEASIRRQRSGSRAAIWR